MENQLSVLTVTDRQPGEWTYEDLGQLPADGNRYEIIEGVLMISCSPSWQHQETLANLMSLLRDHVKAHRLGKILPAPLDVAFNQRNVVQPHILFLSAARRQVLERVLMGAPDLAVGILSPSNPGLDRVKKLNQYALHEIQHYWIVDPIGRTLEAHVLHGGRYTIEWAGADDEIFRPALFPTLEIPLANVWPEEDGAT